MGLFIDDEQYILYFTDGSTTFMSFILIIVKLTFKHLHCHFHDRLGAAESIGGSLDYLPKGSRAQDTTWWRQEHTRSITKEEKQRMCKHTCTLDDSASPSVAPSVAECPLDHWVKPIPHCLRQISLSLPHFKDRLRHPDWNIPAGMLQSHQYQTTVSADWKRLPAHRAQVCHGGTPIWNRREAAWDPHRCTHGHPGSQTQWPSSGSHIVVSVRQRSCEEQIN